MDFSNLGEKPANQPAAANRPSGQFDKKKILYIVIAAVVLLAAFAGYKSYKHNQRMAYLTGEVVEEMLDCITWDKIEYPTLADNSSTWKPGGYFDEVKDSQKLTNAVSVAMEELCTKNDGAEFSPSAIGKVYRLMAVLEYLDYERPEVKATLDNLTAQALEAARSEDNKLTTESVYKDLMRFDGLTYYTSRQEQLKNEEIEQYYNKRWQELKQDMADGKGYFADFIKELHAIACQSPIDVPEQKTSDDSGSELAMAANAVAINQMYLDINKIMPYDELLAALQENGEPAIFRNGEGGYYDYQSIKGTTFGDFARITVSGRAKRTGQEDAFTEQYMREHYDHPDKTYTYFRGEKFGSLPAFFNDTKQVFVYDGSAYAFTNYAFYYNDIMLPYDYEAAKEAEFKHVTTSEYDFIQYMVDQAASSYLRGMLTPLQPELNIDVENMLVTVYLTALPGTTEALQAGQPIPIGQDRKADWHEFVKYLSDMSEDFAYESSVYKKIGVGVILRSDVNPDAGLLSILNGEVVQDNSANPPEPAKTPTAENDENGENGDSGENKTGEQPQAE